MVLINSMLLMNSCKSNNVEVIYYVPDLVFPKYPEPENNVSYDAETDEVKMNLDYYERIKNFKLEVYGVRDYYNFIKENINENKWILK